MKKGKIYLNRVCYACGANSSHLSKKGVQIWYPNHDKDNNYLCTKCYMKYLRNPIFHEKRKGKRIGFRGKEKRMKTERKIGVCNWCRAVVPFDTKRTHMHHDEDRYDENDPERYAIELCMTCHNYETWRLERENNKSTKRGHIKEKRTCFSCGSDKTYVRPNGWIQWNHDSQGHVICKWCYDKLKWAGKL